MNLPTDKNLRALTAIVVYNEGEKLRRTLQTIPADRTFDVLVVDDASTDDVAGILREFDYPSITHKVNSGVGRSIKTAIEYAQKNGYQIIAIAAGNGKMQIQEAEKLIAPIREEGYDYIQGSRYLAGGRYENLPLFRRIAIPIFTWLVWLLTGYKGTDATCGFRAYRLSIVDLPGVNIGQDWLDCYELEFYLHYYATKKKLKIKEVPVAMLYPESMENYSKIKAVTGWWSMIRPWVFLKLGLRK